MNLLNLAPDIQEAILFWGQDGKAPFRLTERHVRPVCSVLEWGEQRRFWKEALRIGA